MESLSQTSSSKVKPSPYCCASITQKFSPNNVYASLRVSEMLIKKLRSITISETLKEALFGGNFGVLEAQQYGEGFTFDNDVCKKDSELFNKCDRYIRLWRNRKIRLIPLGAIPAISLIPPGAIPTIPLIPPGVIPTIPLIPPGTIPDTPLVHSNIPQLFENKLIPPNIPLSQLQDNTSIAFLSIGPNHQKFL
jgi:hypothetical protein